MSNDHTPIGRARQLRKNMTFEEKLLWQKLRGRKFFGLKFLRQHPIIYDLINYKPLFFIADFYCASKNIIIEVDGKIHDFQKDYDERREEILINMGLRVIRFKNEEIRNVGKVLNEIEVFLFDDSP